VHGQVALEQGEQHSIPNGPERVEVQIAAGIVAGMLEAGVAALVALRLDVLGLEVLLLMMMMMMLLIVLAISHSSGWRRG